MSNPGPKTNQGNCRSTETDRDNRAVALDSIQYI